MLLAKTIKIIEAYGDYDVDGDLGEYLPVDEELVVGRDIPVEFAKLLIRTGKAALK